MDNGRLVMAGNVRGTKRTLLRQPLDPNHIFGLFYLMPDSHLLIFGRENTFLKIFFQVHDKTPALATIKVLGITILNAIEVF